MTRRNDMKSIIIEMADKLYREDISKKIKPSKKRTKNNCSHSDT